MLRNKELILVAVILLLATAWFYQDPEWNGNSRLELTRSIVEQGSFQIDSYHAAPGWGTEDTALYAGHFYTDKAIGSSLLAVPFYFLLYQLASIFHITLDSELIKHFLTTIVLGGAFTANGLTLYLVARQITRNPWNALIAAVALSFGTMLWPYSALYYGHVIAGAFLIIAFYLLFSMRYAVDDISCRRLFLAGLAMGFAFLTEYTAALIILGLCFYCVYILRSQKLKVFLRSAGWGSTGALLPLLLIVIYNLMVYKTPFAFGYTHEASNTFLQGMSQGFLGIHFPNLSVLYHITLDPKFGLFWLSPVLILAPIGYLAALRKPTFLPESLLSLYSIAAMLVMNAGYYLWWGGNAFGPRLLIPALPFFIIPLAILPDVLLPILGFLGFFSELQMLIPLIGQIQIDIAFLPRIDAFRVAHLPFHDFSVLYNYGIPIILQRLEQGKASWTLGNAIGLPYWLSIPTLLLLETGLILLFHRSTKHIQTDNVESA